MCRWCPDTYQWAWRWSGGKLWPLQPRVRVYCCHEEGDEMTGGRGKDGELKRWPSRFESATATASSTHAASLETATKLKFRTRYAHSFTPRIFKVLCESFPALCLFGPFFLLPSFPMQLDTIVFRIQGIWLLP